MAFSTAVGYSVRSLSWLRYHARVINLKLSAMSSILYDVPAAFTFFKPTLILKFLAHESEANYR
jgi:hypothetical protein